MSKFYHELGNEKRLSVMAGPCVLESKQHGLDMAGELKAICEELNVNFIYKTSFDKANRTSGSSFRGIDFDEANYAFEAIQQKIGVEIITDVHEDWQCGVINADILQIPAFLCRQTNLLQAASLSGRPVNVKKGQFLAPWDMANVCKKLEQFGAKGIIQTERGTTFGYNNLVVDMRGLDIMKQNRYPVIMDCTHAVQQPGGKGDSSGGDRYFAPILARAATAVGIAGVFMEVHNDPDNAKSDGPNQIKLSDFRGVVEKLLEIDKVVK